MQLSDSENTMEKLFANFDRNTDGKLTWIEIWESFEPIEAKIQAKQFSWRATKAMSAEKFKIMVRQMFDVADNDNSGVLTMD